MGASVWQREDASGGGKTFTSGLVASPLGMHRDPESGSLFGSVIRLRCVIILFTLQAAQAQRVK